MKKIIYILIIFTFLFTISPITKASTYSSGSLLALANTSQATVYYIGEDNKKYAFPDSKTYFTYYDNFDNVQRVNLSTLDSYPDGGTMPYKAGTKLITHQNTAKIYAVEPNGLIRWIPTEEIAINLYGSTWYLKVQDVIPGYFSTSYQLGENLSNTLPNGTIVRLRNTNTYYYIENGQKRVSTEYQNYNTEDIVEVDDVDNYPDQGSSSNNNDTNDDNSTTTPPGGGGGGGGTPTPTPTPTPVDNDSDNDGYDSTSSGGTDCNDSSSSIHPGAVDICGDSIDQDCSGADLACPTPVDNDSDNDGYDSTSSGGTDCNDNSASIHPGATEICGDSIDQDCSGGDLQCTSSDQPTIQSLSDNTLENGQSFTIYGSGFGVNNTTAYWDNFDDGQAQGLDLTTNPGIHDPDISSVEKHSGAYSLRTRLGDIDLDLDSADRNGYAIYWFPQDMQSGDKLFFSFWERWNWGDWYCADGGGANVDYQIKNFRVGSGNHAVDPPAFPQNNQSDCVDWGSSEEFMPRSYFTSMHDGSDWYTRDFSPEMAHLDEKWHLFELQIQQSSPGQADGSFEMWLTREGQSKKVVNFQNIITHQPGDDGFNKITWGNWIDSFGHSTTLYFDDININFSWHRVAIGNNSDYYQSTRREILPYTSWSDGTINVTANLNAFLPSDQLYIFVFDDNGEPSTGSRVYMN